MILGGSQERARRAGLENLMGIVGFGVAAAVLGDARVRVNERERASIQRTRLEQAAEDVDGVSVVGDRDARLPQITCVVVDGIEAEAIVMGLDRSGISVHSGSACSSEALEPSPVLAAMGLDADRSVRVSVGWSTTEGDVERFSERFGSVVSSLRALRD
jgi:cysteine desulfurase